MRFALLIATAFALPAFGQSAQAAGDKEAVTFDEIERGFFVGVSGGPSFIVNSPATTGPRPFSFGQRGQVEIGLDIGPVLSVSGFASGAVNRAPADYTGYSEGKAFGDYASLTVGGTARLNFFALPDAQGVPRTWLYARGGVGYVTFFPAPLFRASEDQAPLRDVTALAGFGVEYYTRLRHFSIGLEAGGQFMLASGTIGFSVTPTLRYAF